MPWWGVPAIVGGALGGLLIAMLVAGALGSRPVKQVDQTGGGPAWHTDRSVETSRFSQDNDLRFNPVPVAVGLGAVAAISGLAVGLALT